MRDPKIAQLEPLLMPAVEALGYIWWGCQLKHHGRGILLRVYIDHPNGVTVDDCARASHQISGVLMVNEPTAGAYTLEVSSPGLDRFLFTLPQYAQFKGHKVKLRLKFPQQGQRNFQGVIEETAIAKREVVITIEDNTEERKIFQFDEIEHANLVPDFGD